MTASGTQELGADLKMLLIVVSVCIGLLYVLGLPLLWCCCPSRNRTFWAGGVWGARRDVAHRICKCIGKCLCEADDGTRAYVGGGGACGGGG